MSADEALGIAVAHAGKPIRWSKGHVANLHLVDEAIRAERLPTCRCSLILAVWRWFRIDEQRFLGHYHI